MERLLKNSFILLALMSVLFVSCKKEYDTPPIHELPFGDTLTIGDILATPANVPFNGASVCGIVTADEQSGNLYKAIFIQDRATGEAIELMLNTSSAARIGDSVRVYLDSTIVYNLYHNLPQLVNKRDGKGFNPDGHLIIYPYNDPIEPETVTISDIKSGKYTAGLVKLENVEFVDQGSNFCNLGETTNRTLKDATGEIIVRTSNYANFAYDPLPVGSGSLVAIASVYNSDWQLILRSKKEFNFEGGTPVPPAAPGELQSLPYRQSFATDFGTYIAKDVSGPQSWAIDYSTAKMTGYVDGVNNANEDWLISSPVDLTGVNNATMTMVYIGRYFNKINDDVTIWASTDYVWNSDPSTAQWEQVPSTLKEGSNWSDFLTVEISLSKFVGQKVTFAVKYLSNSTKAGTMEIQSITIDEDNGDTPPTPPTPGGELQNMPYAQSFEEEFGTYITKDVLGPQSWVIDYSTAKMTGYAGSSHANEDWLISSPVAVTGVSEAKVSVNYAAQYQNSDANDITLQVSKDYVYGNDPSSANWTQMSVIYPNTSNWSDFRTVETSLNDFIGQNITVAIKYTSTDNQARTIEIKSITVQEGHADGGDTPDPPTPPTPGEGEGSGTADDPYNVAAGIVLQSEEPIAWVQGYIVGAVKSGLSSVGGNSDVNWSAPFDLNTNVVIADDANCHEITQCIIVNLPAGKPLRTQVNLVDNPGNLGKKLAVNGKLRKYFGQAGLRDSGGTENDFVLEGGDTPPTPPTPGDDLFSETFANGQGEFTIKDVNLSGLSYVWSYMNNFKCMKANGYYQGAHATESWLVSPQIDLSNVNTATLSFDHAVAFASAQGSFFVMASVDYSGDVTSATWTELNIGSWPEPNPSWVFESATADLSGFAGKKVTIAFKYTSTMDACPAWELKNVLVKE